MISVTVCPRCNEYHAPDGSWVCSKVREPDGRWVPDERIVVTGSSVCERCARRAHRAALARVSRKAQRQWMRKYHQRVDPPRKCETCHKKIPHHLTDRSTRRYCSIACRQWAYRRRRQQA